MIEFYRNIGQTDPVWVKGDQIIYLDRITEDMTYIHLINGEKIKIYESIGEVLKKLRNI